MRTQGDGVRRDSVDALAPGTDRGAGPVANARETVALAAARRRVFVAAARRSMSVAAARGSVAVAAALRASATLLLIGAVRAYQLLLSPWIGNRCRHQPTCSAYAVEAIRRFGPLHGGWLSAKRIARCQPWGTWGYDPVADPDSARRRDGDRTSAREERGV